MPSNDASPLILLSVRKNGTAVLLPCCRFLDQQQRIQLAVQLCDGLSVRLLLEACVAQGLFNTREHTKMNKPDTISIMINYARNGHTHTQTHTYKQEECDCTHQSILQRMPRRARGMPESGGSAEAAGSMLECRLYHQPHRCLCEGASSAAAAAQRARRQVLAVQPETATVTQVASGGRQIGEECRESQD